MSSNTPRSITLLGALPPTIGGISIHVERLADSLARDGWDVKVFDLFSPAGTPSVKPYPVVCGRGWSSWLRLLADGLFRRPSLTHLHISSGRNLPRMGLYLLWIRMWSHVILTVHSGNAARDMASYSRGQWWLAGLAFHSSHRIVCVNPQMVAYLKQQFPKLENQLRHVIPFIVHPKAQRRRPLVERRPVFLASGYGTPLYEWLTLIEACDALDSVGVVHLAFYNTYDPEYFPQIEAACARNPAKYQIHKDLTPDAFAELLGSVDGFVRPTLTDGDSIAVREALALGIPVVASDSVPRPPGCVLFETRNAAALQNALESLIQAGLPAPITTVSCGARAMISLYEELLEKPQAAPVNLFHLWPRKSELPRH